MLAPKSPGLHCRGSSLNVATLRLLPMTGVFPFIFASMVIHLKFHTGFSSDADKLYAGANQMVTEAFSSIRVIHAYNLQSFVSGSYGKMIVSA